MRICLILLGVGLLANAARAEDGYDLWLRYKPLPAPERARDAPQARTLVGEAATPTLRAARDELVRGLGGLTGAAPRLAGKVAGEGAVVFGTPRSSHLIAGLRLPLEKVGPEGYVVRSVRIDGRPATVIAANSDVGVLYGAFRLLRQVQTGAGLKRLDIVSSPALKLRIIDHWDNLDRSVERGYAGASLWNWPQLPEVIDPRYVDYARAEASIGVNGAVLNNVNAKSDSLTTPYLKKAAALAAVFRPYGVKVYLTARFSSPKEIGGLDTADPLDPRVRAFWRAKADEIYRLIPDFGGFLVKANSEGMPGPQDYGRDHADGANMLAEALAPHGGVVMWRAFVYSKDVPDDRAKQAFNEFRPLDGKFLPNVLVQAKNGPIDFMPREPFHPLFGAMPKTPLMMEFQVTKEYLGQSTHLVFLGPLYEEVLKSDTFTSGPGATVAKVIERGAGAGGPTGMAGGSNIGSDRNWNGTIFDQANWYALGRFAWDPESSSRQIAEDWVRMTFGHDPAFVHPVVAMMLASRETTVNYMTPLGLHHIMAVDTHFGPGPWVTAVPRVDWSSPYYHHADAGGIGFDRTSTGSNAVAQYAPEVAAKFASLGPDSEKTLLWFHHLPWDYRTSSGRTLWDELVVRYSEGVKQVGTMRATWSRMRPYVDAERFEEVAGILRTQEREAKWWRDACIAYFQTFSKRPMPAGYAPPPHPSVYYEARLQPADDE
jgi:alpha-glucuronidase